MCLRTIAGLATCTLREQKKDERWVTNPNDGYEVLDTDCSDWLPSVRFFLFRSTRAIEDHLRCLAADPGRTGAQLLGDERSGSAESPFGGGSQRKRADLVDSGHIFC
jgi:hypothetical protein